MAIFKHSLTWISIRGRNNPNRRSDKRSPHIHLGSFNIAFTVSFISMIILFTTPASAQPLYQGLDVGSPVSEVLEIFPAAKIDKENSNQSIQKYRLEGSPSAGMWTYFVFENGLQEVRIHGRGADLYLEVLAGLKKKYGPPTSEGQAASSRAAIWEVLGLTIKAVLSRDENLGLGFVAREPFTVSYRVKSENPLSDGL